MGTEGYWLAVRRLWMPRFFLPIQRSMMDLYLIIALIVGAASIVWFKAFRVPWRRRGHDCVRKADNGRQT